MLAVLWRFLGSIQLAVPLLGAIASILIFATFYEADIGTATVQHAIYKSPWFGCLMFLLVVNLSVSASHRYPWRGPRKIGFALTHLGLIVLIAGSAAVIHLGDEGMLWLHTNSSANNRIRQEGDRLELATPDRRTYQTDIFINQKGAIAPHSLADISLLDYTENSIQTISFSAGAPVSNPAIQLSLKSDRMNQTLKRWLAIAPLNYHQLSLGPAQLEFLQANSLEELQTYLKPPTENSHQFGIIELESDSRNQQLDVRDTLGKTVEFTDNLQVELVNFWPDFQLDSQNQPRTASQELRNPAVQLEITADTGVERWFIFGRQDYQPVRYLVAGKSLENLSITYQVQFQPLLDYFRAITSPDGQLFYSANSSTGFKSGALEVGTPVSPGWADFQITLEQYIPNAQLHRQVLPASDPTINGVPALLVKTKAGKEQWLPWGEPTKIGDDAVKIFAAFKPKMLTLPFAIALEDFIVERNEGSETVAMWTSKIRIEDGDKILHRDVWMNHPAWYRGWKIAQASWNPTDLQESTLQIKREPLWVTALTWGGSLLVICGIGIMFYGPFVVNKLPKIKSDTRLEIGRPTEINDVIV